MNQVEKDERRRLQDVKAKLSESIQNLNNNMQRYAREIREEKAYLWENKSGMDHVEKISVRQSVGQAVMTAEAVLEKRKRLDKLLASPYFGRFDFCEKGQQEALEVYVGIHTYFDEETRDCLIYDWRAPISTMFYDYELGAAQFLAPYGMISGDIALKRQYRIREGAMEYMLESDINILDDVLQKELSAASDEKMKNIVATIQRDQNRIIRDEKTGVLIIQGVAGSGKTSIALHRIAFLLYRYKETIQSRDVLIISPNKVFADYISNVLPELGEEDIPEMVMEELANDLLEREFKFQTFFEQVSYLLENTDQAYQERIEAKASLSFLHQLQEYTKDIEKTYFQAVDLTINGRIVPAWFLEERFQKFPNMPLFKRLDKLVGDVDHNVNIFYQYRLSANERQDVKNRIQKMFKISTLKGLYKDFYQWLGRPDLLNMIRHAKLEYADVFPLLFLKMKCVGLEVNSEVKHLLIDEMQDYTAVQYHVLSYIFPCRKTILGDVSQSVNPFSSSSAEDIQKIFKGSKCVYLQKSYRSTFEITRFAQRISSNPDADPMERHGEDPKIIKVPSQQDEMKEILKQIRAFESSSYQSMGIICKVQSEAEALYKSLKKQGCAAKVLSNRSSSFSDGVIICTAYMAKGLEFDCVLVPHVTQKNYHSPLDRSMLYVACTRAMHQLTVTSVKTSSDILKNRF